MHTTSRRVRTLGASIAALALVATTALTAAAEPDGGEYLGNASDFGQDVATLSVDEQLELYGDVVIPDRWLVELDGKNTNDLVRAASAEGVDVEVVTSYDLAWQGASVVVDDEEIEKVAALSGVSGVYPVLEVTNPVLDTVEPTVETGKELTGADVANEELGYTGQGIRVGIIDSGIDYNHPDFGGSGTNDERRDFPNERVRWGYDFVGDDYDARYAESDVPKPDRFPDDCGGHGTHVAGIVGANGDIKGVAPDVQFGAYRVFGCDGSSSSDIILAAMEMARRDRMDVVNMSLGAAFMTWPSYPTAVAADRLVKDGIVVVVSQGNEGLSGTFSGGAPAVAHDVISVGSVDNTLYMSDYFETAGGLEIPFRPSTGAPNFPAGAEYTFVAADPFNGCPANPPAEATEDGQALLVSRGDCTFHEKALTAQTAGYDALLIANNTGGVINATVEGDTPITIPVGTILQADGAAFRAEIVASGSSEATVAEEPKRFDNPTGGYQSDFSSYGLAADLTLKPDVSAPGGSIYSTWPLELGEYHTTGGTSMAAPHVAGAAALLLEAKPRMKPLEVRSALTNTANPFDWSLVKNAGYLEPVHRQGGGLVDIAQALTTKVSIEASKISLGEGEHGPVTTELTVTNRSDQAKTFALGADHGVTTYGPPSNPGFYALEADVSFSSDTITVPAGREASFTVTIGEDFGVDGAIYGGWITLTGETEDFVVPFAGLSGDYQALTALDLALTAFVEDDTLYVADPFREFSMEDGDVPYVYFNLAYPVSALYIDVYHANADGTRGRPVHPVFNNYLTYIDQGRLSAPAAIPWDGTVQHSNGKGKGKGNKTRQVENGAYVLQIRVLKALGDPKNPDHWETWDSAPVIVDAEDDHPGKGRGKNPAAPIKGRPGR